MSLQYGVPLQVLVDKFSYTRFEPLGFTKNEDIRMASSLVDYIFRWLGIQFIEGFREQHQPKAKQTQQAADDKAVGKVKKRTGSMEWPSSRHP